MTDPANPLLEIPVTQMLAALGAAIGRAQLDLLQLSVDMGELLASTKVVSSNPAVHDKSLLELGFRPIFQRVSEAELNVALTLTLKGEGAPSLAAAPGEAELFASPLTPGLHRKHGFDTSGASHLKVRLVEEAAPAAYITALTTPVP